MTTQMLSIDEAIEKFYEETKKMIGKEIVEREAWNNDVTPSAVRHYAYGIGDDNPRWIDPDYKDLSGRRVAPPAFLTSVYYPLLHGANMQVPLSSLIGGVKYKWYSPVYVGDTITGTGKIVDVYKKIGRNGRTLIFVISEVVYKNQKGEVVAIANGTMIRAKQVGTELLEKRSPYKYNARELAQIENQIKQEFRSGHKGPDFSKIEIGSTIGPVVKGPLTIGDMVAWNAGNGPGYRAAELAWKDVWNAPHIAVIHPVTGHPVKYSLQHEDFNMSSQRGMPLPFANGVMIFAWSSTLLTNWIGDKDMLEELDLRLNQPYYYGDTLWVTGTVTSKELSEDGKGRVSLTIEGVNQLGDSIVTGTAKVLISGVN